MQEFNEKFSKFISNVKTTDTELAKKFTSDVKTYCKKNNIPLIIVPYWERDNMKDFILKEYERMNLYQCSS